jgi:hypothetical protein
VRVGGAVGGPVVGVKGGNRRSIGVGESCAAWAGSRPAGQAWDQAIDALPDTKKTMTRNANRLRLRCLSMTPPVKGRSRLNAVPFRAVSIPKMPSPDKKARLAYWYQMTLFCANSRVISAWR